MKSKIFAFFNQKGGVGKTTSSINLAINLSSLNQKVLLIDFDPLANASLGIGIYNNANLKSLFSVYIDEAKIENIIIKNVFYDLDVICAKKDLINIKDFKNSNDNWFLKALQKIKHNYDFIIIDTPPGFNIINKLILKTITDIIIPIQPQYFALDSLFKILALIKLNNSISFHKTKILGILLTMFDQRINLAKDVYQKVSTIFKQHLFKTIIYKNIKLAEAIAYGKPINIYDKQLKTKNYYFILAQEILNKYE